MPSLAQEFRAAVLFLACMVSVPMAAPAQKADRPLNQQEVQDLVQNYVPSERIIGLIHQFGINFEPSEQYLKDLRKAGANVELIGALRAVRPRIPVVPQQAPSPEKSEQAGQKAPLSFEQVSNLLVNHIPGDAIAELVGKYGISFDPDKDYMNSLRNSGADQKLLAVLRKAKRFPPPAAAPTAPKVEQKTRPKEAATTTPAPGVSPPKHAVETTTAQTASQPAVKPPKQAVETKTARIMGEPAAKPPAPKPPEPHGPYNVGGDVSPPSALYTPNAPYTEQARRAHLQGTVVLGIVINEHGKVTQIQELSKPLGMGLDESAIQAVGSWVFRAAQFRGVPVPVRVNVQVGFHQQY
jgi:TonB family protein